MSKSQRTKGAVFEREVSKIFTDYFGEIYQRNIGQARDGGCDLNVGPWMVECKRRASLKVLRQWMQQAAVSAGGDYPAVVMREDGGAAPMVLIRMQEFLRLLWHSGDVR